MFSEKRRAFVTGSTSGIGLGVAEALAQAGSDVVLHGLGEATEIEALRQRLSQQYGVNVDFFEADVSNGAQFEQRLAQLHGIDILVNNAGIQHVAPLEDFALARWDAVIAINLTAVFIATKMLLAGMRERGWGRIINIASVHGQVASIHKAAYVAAKHGVVGLTKVTALETAGSGVTCNAICPGWVLTPLVQAQIEARAQREGKSIEQAGRELLLEKQPGGRFATPAEIGALAVFLSGDHSASITGASLPIDGAWLAQ